MDRLKEHRSFIKAKKKYIEKNHIQKMLFIEFFRV